MSSSDPRSSNLAKLNRANREAARLRKLELSEIDQRASRASTSTHLAAQFGQVRISAENPEAVETYSSSPSASTPTRDDMSKPVLFYGKTGQLDDVLTFCTVRFLSEQTVLEEAKAGYLASLFRGPALSWLTQELKENPRLLDSYSEFTTRVTAVFGLDETAKQSQAARALAACKQKTSAQEYALRFQHLAKAAGVPDATAVAFFKKGLKQHIRTALITQDEQDSLDEAVTEAIRLDSQLFYARGTRFPTHGKKNKGRDSKGRFKPTTGIKHEFDY